MSAPRLPACLQCESGNEPPVATGDECVPTDDSQDIVSGFACASACPAGELTSSVFTCSSAAWELEPECIDLASTLTCSAASVVDVAAGVVGISGDGCDQLTAVGTTCDVVCADGWWGSGQVTCSADSRRRLQDNNSNNHHHHHAGSESAAAKRRLLHHRERMVQTSKLNRATLTSSSADGDARRPNTAARSGRSVGAGAPRLLATVTMDCKGQPLSDADVNRLGDGVCDSVHTGSDLDFFCSVFDDDAGDCPEAQYGRDCDGNMYINGVGDPYLFYDQFLGDGVCDDGSYGPNFDCTALSYDNGDCQSLTPTAWAVSNDTISFVGCTNAGNASEHVPLVTVSDIVTTITCLLPSR